jgi:hypothetical protein
MTLSSAFEPCLISQYLIPCPQRIWGRENETRVQFNLFLHKSVLLMRGRVRTAARKPSARWKIGKFFGGSAGSRSGWSEKYVAGYVAKCYTILKNWQLLS